jgi:hypothetical protein
MLNHTLADEHLGDHFSMAGHPITTRRSVRRPQSLGVVHDALQLAQAARGAASGCLSRFPNASYFDV